MFSKCLNSKKQGEVGLSKAIAYYTQKGCIVSIPLCDNQDYDLIIDYGNKLYKVQVKTTKYKTNYNIYSVNLRVFGGNKHSTKIKMFDASLVDLLYVLTELGDEYSIPSREVKVKNSLSLGRKMAPFRGAFLV